MRTEGEVCV